MYVLNALNTSTKTTLLLWVAQVTTYIPKQGIQYKCSGARHGLRASGASGLGLRLRFHHATMALPIGLAAQGGVFRPQEHRNPTRLGRELVAVKLHGRVEVGTILRTKA